MENLRWLAISVVLWAAPAPAAPAALVPAASDHINHQRWVVRDGLVQQTVTDVIEASDGYLWLTTYGGLARFDGVRFENYVLEDVPELGTNKLVSLLEDSNRNLWIGTVEGGVVRRNATGFKAFDKSGTPQLDIQDFAEDAEGHIWAAGHGLSRLVAEGNREVFEPVTEPAWLPGTEVGDLLVTADGTLWAATARGLLKKDGDRFVLVNDSDAARHARGLVSDLAGRLWLISRHGISYLEGDKLIAAHALDEAVYSAALDEDGTVLAGIASGLLRLTVESGRVSASKVELPHDDESLQSGVTALYRDRAGNVWAGTNSFGLVRINRVAFAQYEDPRGLQHGSVLHLASDPRGGVWVQGQEGWLLHGADGVFSDPSEVSGWAVPTGASLLGVTRAGYLWLHRDGELFRVRGSLTSGFATDSYSVDVAGGLVEAADGTIWFGGIGNIHQFVDENFLTRSAPGISGKVLPQLEASDGSIWFFTDGALGRLSGQGAAVVWELVGQGNPALRAELRSLHEDSSGTMWLSTYGNGLVRLRNGQLQQIGKTHGLAELSLGGIVEDASRRLWVNSNSGVIIIPLAEVGPDEPEIRARLLGSPETNGPAAAVDGQGRMWFPTVRGLVVADPRQYLPDATPPVVHIERVLLDGRALAPQSMIRVPAGVQRITVDYTGIWLRQPELVRFRYRLTGYQDEWIDAGSQRTAFFTKVPPGNYQFEVAAVSGDGVWAGASAPLPIAVAARYYQTLWFRVGAVAAVVMLFFGLHRRRVINIERHSQELQREIDNRKKAERERALMESSLMESSRMESIGRLAGGIAHDFNNVLTAVLGHAEQARDGLPSDAAEVDVHLDGIVDCSERAAALTRQLLAFSRQQVLLPRQVDANDVIGQLQPMLEQLLPENVHLHWLPQRDLPVIMVDPSQLEQVVMNLVLNARDAMPEGGTITIATRTRSVSAELAWPTSSVSAGHYVEIDVSDSGYGIDPDVLARVFDPFFTTKQHGHGTGLGLASVHGIVTQSGGHVRVDSTPLQGARFRVLLPVTAGSASRQGRPPEPCTGDLDGGESILVCEDDDGIRSMLVNSLRGRGYHVTAAAQPTALMRQLRHNRPVDLLITDMMLPQLSGQELADQLRKIHPQAAVLFISGYPGNQLEVSSQDTVFLQKPFKPSVLLRVVRDVLDQRSEQRYMRLA